MREHTLPLPTWFLQVVFRVEAAEGVAVIHSERVGGATEAVGVAAFNFLSSCSARFCVCKRAFWQNGMDACIEAAHLPQTETNGAGRCNILGGHC